MAKKSGTKSDDKKKHISQDDSSDSTLEFFEYLEESYETDPTNFSIVYTLKNMSFNMFNHPDLYKFNEAALSQFKIIVGTLKNIAPLTKAETFEESLLNFYRHTLGEHMSPKITESFQVPEGIHIVIYGSQKKTPCPPLLQPYQEH